MANRLMQSGLYFVRWAAAAWVASNIIWWGIVVRMTLEAGRNEPRVVWVSMLLVLGFAFFVTVGVLKAAAVSTLVYQSMQYLTQRLLHRTTPWWLELLVGFRDRRRVHRRGQPARSVPPGLAPVRAAGGAYSAIKRF